MVTLEATASTEQTHVTPTHVSMEHHVSIEEVLTNVIVHMDSKGIDVRVLWTGALKNAVRTEDLVDRLQISLSVIVVTVGGQAHCVTSHLYHVLQQPHTKVCRYWNSACTTEHVEIQAEAMNVAVIEVIQVPIVRSMLMNVLLPLV
uniref:Uncharacterized protein n=1 Tax=Arion vulgaris TaxID=1028688 RepID=A0A0B7B544_9EUPU